MRRALLITLCLLQTVVVTATERTIDEVAAIAARFSTAKAPRYAWQNGKRYDTKGIRLP